MRKETKVGLAIAVFIILLYLTFVHIYYEAVGFRFTLYNLFRVCHTFEQVGGLLGIVATGSPECSNIYLAFFSSIILMFLLSFYIIKNFHYISFSASQILIILLGIVIVYLFNRGVLTFDPTTLAIGVEASVIGDLSSTLNSWKLSQYNITKIENLVKNPVTYLNSYICTYGTLKMRNKALVEINPPPDYYIEDNNGYFIYITPEPHKKYELNRKYVICGYFKEAREKYIGFLGWGEGKVLYYYIDTQYSEKI